MSNSLLSFDVSTTWNLTITSVLYNPTNHVSDWVDKLFGSRAVFHQAYIDEIRGISYDVGKEPLDDEEIFQRTQRFRNEFLMPNYALRPGCSVDLLGYVHVSDEGQFNPSLRLRSKAFVGRATLTIEKRSIKWGCYYRPVYENWRTEKSYSSPNYWAVIFYCPSPSLTACESVEGRYDAEAEGVNSTVQHFKSEFGKVSMKTPSGDRWDATFKSIPFTTKKQQYKPHYSTRAKINPKTLIDSAPGILTKPKNIPPAVCLSIPYTSTDSGKEVANGAMLLEWIRYYAVLGFKVLIYDRDGANRKHIYNSTYGNAQNVRIPKGSFVYHPYTIRGILDPSKKGLKYDNTEIVRMDDDSAEELGRKGRFESQGHDKVQTLTHCRFEAKALYGIETVLVADFDEFLYCPVVGATARAQGGWIHQFLSHMKALGVSQIEFSQRVVFNKTASPRDCVVGQVKKGRSIFDCFSSYLYYNGAHSLKSVHLDHSCPLTGYHNACPGSEVPRSHDCSCTSHIMKSNNYQPYEYVEGRECALIHLSTNMKSYGKELYALNGADKISCQKSILEISTVLNSNKKKKIKPK